MLSLTPRIKRLLRLLREDSAASWVSSDSDWEEAVRICSLRKPGQQLAMRSTSAVLQGKAPSSSSRVSCGQHHKQWNRGFSWGCRCTGAKQTTC